MEVLSKFGLKRRSFFVAHNYLEETEEEEGKKERKKNREVNSLYHSETPTVRIFSVVDYRNVLARNSRIITEKCSARARSARTSMQHAIDRKAIRSGLSVALFITLPGSLLREDPPARLPMESLQRLRYFLLSFSLAPFLYSPYGLLISHSSYPFSPLRQARFSSKNVENREMLDSGQSQRAFLRLQIFSHSMWFQLFLTDIGYAFCSTM